MLLFPVEAYMHIAIRTWYANCSSQYEALVVSVYSSSLLLLCSIIPQVARLYDISYDMSAVTN